MKYTSVLLYVLRTPSRWGSILKFAFAWLLGREDVMIASDGVKLRCGIGRGEGVWCALRGLDYEPELKLFLSAIKQGDIVIDLGANIGTYAIRSAKIISQSGLIYAFEPFHKTRRRLEDAIKRNACTNIIVVPKAAGAYTGQAEIVIHGRGSSASLISEKQGGEVFSIPLITIDDFVKESAISRLDWVKMDIEGAEPLALSGMEATVARFRPCILFENESGGAASQIWLQQHGYLVGNLCSNGTFYETSHGSNLFGIPSEKTKIFLNK